MGFPGGTSGKEPACQCRGHKRCEFNPWAGKIPWRRAWEPTPVFLPEESHGQRSLAGYSLWDRKESASLAQRFPASSVLAREGAGCGSVGDVTGAWLASAPLSPSLWT